MRRRKERSQVELAIMHSSAYLHEPQQQSLHCTQYRYKVKTRVMGLSSSEDGIIVA